MADARLTHPTRVDLPFHQRQSDEDPLRAVADIANELGVDRPSLVHTTTRERQRTVRGRVTANRRADNDSTTADGRQALANYADLLESHVDEFQGTGYIFEDDELGVTRQAVLESISWRVQPGQPDEFEFEASVIIGRGTFEDRTIVRRNPTYDESMTAMASVDGTDLTGMRLWECERSVGVSPTAVFDRDSAENNDALIDEGVQQQFVFEGTHTGDPATREAANTTLSNLVGQPSPVTLETKFPGYSVEGFVTAYETQQQQRMGDQSHQYRLEFVIGQEA